MTTSIIRLSENIPAEPSNPAPDRILAGAPKQSVANYFSDPTNQFHVGRWTSTPGTWRVRYTENELCVITDGEVVLTGDDGAVNSFGAGDAFVIPAGFSGTWKVLRDCTKIYAIFEKGP